MALVVVAEAVTVLIVTRDPARSTTVMLAIVACGAGLVPIRWRWRPRRCRRRGEVLGLVLSETSVTHQQLGVATGDRDAVPGGDAAGR